nr:uncharacterized protein LOC113714284 [Coffea arabica]
MSCQATKFLVLKVITRALFLAFVIVSLPWLNTAIGDLTSKLNNGARVSSVADQIAVDDPNDAVGTLSVLFHDLANEGLLKMGDRALIISNGDDHEAAIFNTQAISDYNMDVVSCSDVERQSLIPNQTYDLVFVRDFHAASELIERIIKKDGTVTVQLNSGGACGQTFSSSKETIARLNTEVKKKALNNLEDVLLEPPRAASGKSNSYRKRTRFLPDLIGDSLESYSRRVFIDVGLPDKNDDSSGDVSWFKKNYPTKNTEFEVYKIETVNEGPSREEVAQIGMSDWLRKNLKGNEYVVMKAEAEVVEELVRSKAIKLVDELFLECKHRGIKKSVKRSRRAYWECLALYGSLRDEGIAVHQWWG